MRRYFTHLMLAAVIISAILVGMNWVVDPYRIFGAPEISGFNIPKTRLPYNIRIFKTVNLARQQPSVALLGSSRAEIGLNPLHPVFSGRKTLNLAMDGQSYAETKMLVDYFDPKKTRQIILGIDFFAANAMLPLSSIDPKNFSAYRILELLISLSTVVDSFKTLTHMGREPGSQWTKEGRRIYDDMTVRMCKGNHRFFLRNEEIYLTKVYHSASNRAFELDADNGRYAQSPLSNVRALLARAYLENIDLHLFISPSHARQWETLAAAGLWDKWEEWKRRLTKMNEEEAARAGKSPFPLWDFSGYNSISIEVVPALDDTTTFMKNYFDSSHYTPAVGDLVLDRILNYHDAATVPEDFGVRLTSANLDSQLGRIRFERAQYRKTHPDDVAEIESLAGKVAESTSKRIHR